MLLNLLPSPCRILFTHVHCNIALRSCLLSFLGLLDLGALSILILPHSSTSLIQEVFDC